METRTQSGTSPYSERVIGSPVLPPLAKVNTVDSSDRAARNPALDFTKGILVLIMVLYHWLNYFYAAQFDIYKYLRFLTPSFICITGFLVSNIYIGKYGVMDRSLPGRLFQRSLKILGVFVVLNLIRTALLSPDSRADILAEHSSLRGLMGVYLIGGSVAAGQAKTVAFSILIPISYLLVLSALLLIVCRYYKHAFYLAWVTLVAAVFVVGGRGVHSSILEMVTIGLLGVIMGYAPIERVNSIVRHPVALALAYAGYLTAINKWNVIYPLQVIGVVLSLMIIYLVGETGNPNGKFKRLNILLGKYSLWGYVAQIAILQLLHGGLRSLDLGETATMVISFIAAFALTILAVQAMDRARRSSKIVDRSYRAVFA